MLKDGVRTNSYRKAIVENGQLFKGKTVLDVGCGTGILSMFCVQAGASHVYAVDCSDIINQAKQIIKDNGFSEKITCIQAKVEDMTLPCKVDIIVSEWMGYFLLYESMLNTVIYARDHFMKPGGILLPDKANMYIAGIEDAEYKQTKIEFWNNVYGYDMSCIKNIALREPLVDIVENGAIVTSAHKFLSIDLNTVKVEDLTFTSQFSVKATRNDFVHAFIAWFDIEFSACFRPITFSTGPGSKYTHWKQTVFYTTESITIAEKEEIKGSLTCKPNAKNPRDLDISLKVDFDGKYTTFHNSQEYYLR